MHILLYVITFLMLLAVITTYRIDSAQSMAAFQAAYRHYMQAIERAPIQKAAEKWYGQLTIGRHVTHASSAHAAGTRRLSLYLLTNSEAREQLQNSYEQTRTLAKQLMALLCKDSEEFKEALEKRPQLFDDILTEIQNACDQLPTEKKVKNVVELTALPFSSPEVKYFFVQLMGGQPKIEQQPPENLQIDSIIETDEESDLKTESAQAHARQGYRGLQDFISLDSSNQIRVQLADPLLLEAIFEDIHLVGRIQQVRLELVNRIKSARTTGEQLQLEKQKEEARLEFKNAFEHAGSADKYSTLLNFAITGTTPNNAK